MSEAAEAAKQLRQCTAVMLAGLPGVGATRGATATRCAAAAASSSGGGECSGGGGGAARKAMVEEEQRVLKESCSVHAAHRLRQVSNGALSWGSVATRKTKNPKR